MIESIKINKRTPAFTIIIPVYNGTCTITKAIQSVVRQYINNWELIIVDDGSNENIKNIISDYLKDDRVKYYFKNHKGVSSARNYGISLALGQYIIFLDDDDYFHEGLLKEICAVNYMNYDLISWSAQKLVDGKVIHWKPEKLGRLYRHKKISFLAGSVCYNKELFKKTGGFDENLKYGENYELGLRICQIKNLRIFIIDFELVTIVINSFERTSNSALNQANSYLYQLKKHKSLLKKFPKDLSKFYYNLAYNLESLNKIKLARKFYFNSWKANIFDPKGFIKFYYLKWIR